MPAVTVVVAVYNAKTWLPRFFASLRRQTLRDFEVLMVDDASTDESTALIEKTVAVDPRFRLIRLTVNSGAGKARNIGIREASGETICFADPDDLLPENSLEARYAAYKRHNAIVRACHDEIGEDGSVRNHETRPDRLPELFSPATEAEWVGVNAFLCAHWTWLVPTELLRRHKIFNGENMRTAEDIILLSKLFFHVGRMVWISDTVYYWMKHEESLSTTQYTAEHYENYFQCCDVFYREAEIYNHMELADHFFDGYLALYPGHLLTQAAQGKSDERDAQKLIAVMTLIAERYAVFRRYAGSMRRSPSHYAGLNRLMAILKSKSRSALMRLLESQQVLNKVMEEKRFETVRTKGWSGHVSFDKLDRERGLVRARYLFCNNVPEERFTCYGSDGQPAYAKNRSVYSGDGYDIFERILWLALPTGINDRITLTIAGQDSGLNHTAQQLQAVFTPRPLNDAGFPPEVRALRRLATSPVIQKKFKDAWLFIDRDTEADDNAEHLYRWVQKNHPEVNAWFVLNEDSHDWKRLQEEGFRLIPHGSVEHGALFLLCRKLISSQRDRYIFAPLENQYFNDFPSPQFICLAHGVIKDDMSPWLNTVPCDIFISTTHDEAQSISGDGTPYLVTAKEHRVTGLPRYDRLLEPCQKENIILVMPTWRADLVGKWDGKGQRREINPNFHSSKYVATWRDVFEEPHFKNLLQRFDYRVVFFSHPGFSDYLNEMPFPSFVQKLSKKHGSLGETMRKSKVMITDFSSVAFDMAYMRKPVVYYHYEDKSCYIKSQAWANGYFNYQKMGFGPVCQDKESLFVHLEEALEADGQMQTPYLQRAERTFAYNDACCCQRVFEAITEKESL